MVILERDIMSSDLKRRSKVRATMRLIKKDITFEVDTV